MAEAGAAAGADGPEPGPGDGVGVAIAAATLAVAVEEAVRQRVFVSYTRTNPTTGEVYSGRTSGYGNDAQAIVNSRAGGHPDRLTGFGPPVVDKAATGLKGYSAIRGREQQLIDSHGRAKSDGGTYVNEHRGVRKGNPLGGRYHKDSNELFGQLHSYTGN